MRDEVIKLMEIHKSQTARMVELITMCREELEQPKPTTKRKALIEGIKKLETKWKEFNK